MDISAACLPPRQPHISDQDRKHPLFPTYQRYRASMTAQLVEASGFRDWLGGYERDLEARRFQADPRFPEFMAWMQANKGGARRCPAGSFPHNFTFWCEGGRW